MKQKEQAAEFDRFMRIPEVAHVTGLSRSTIYDCVSKGTFPSPVRLTPRAIAWRESEVKHWMDERKREVA
mgnify:FL=1